MATLTKADVLGAPAASGVAPRKVPVPAWGGDVFVRKLDATERMALECHESDTADNESRLAKAEKRPYDWKRVSVATRLRAVAACLCDEKGVPLFEVVDEGVAALGVKDGDSVDRLYVVAADFNGLGVRAVEQLLGN